jgi:hypothetical protein
MLATRVLALAAILGLTGMSPTTLGAIPAFARRYKVSCQLCHNPIPKLTDFGLQFAANGYRFASGEGVSDTVGTGDPLLTLLKEVPLAIRLDTYAQLYADGKAAVDFQTPYGLKLLSGGPVTKSISYYFYTFLVERGDIGGVEDAFIHVNDIAGAPVDFMIGQFQVSDPLFKRELRLSFEDYAVYRVRVGDVPANLTYERGIMTSLDLAGFTLTGEVLNGNGVEPAQPDRRFDVDASKNVFGHLTRDVFSSLRLGVFGYYGRSHGNQTTDVTRMVGVDGTFEMGPVQINGQYVHRRDDEPTYAAGEVEVRVNGGFGELIIRPPGSRFFGYGLYNLVSADRPLLDVGEGGPPNVSRYETVAGGLGYVIARNVKVHTEIQYDLEQESTRLSLGAVLAY